MDLHLPHNCWAICGGGGGGGDAVKRVSGAHVTWYGLTGICVAQLRFGRKVAIPAATAGLTTAAALLKQD